jgi:Tfp pilus assembly protein PilE
MYRRTNFRKSGLTLIEILIVVAILMVLMITGMVFVQPSLSKGRDGKKKSDLQQISVALEEYYNNKASYPAALTTCGETSEIASVLKKVPCEGSGSRAYLYIADPVGCDAATVRCSGYRLLTDLAYDLDTDIAKKGCTTDFGGKKGCHQAGGIVYDYGVAVGRSLADY